MSIEFKNLKKRILRTRPNGYEFPSGLSSDTRSLDISSFCSGGTKTTDSTNTVHTFTSTGNFVISQDLVSDISVEYLVVGGGGGWWVAGSEAEGL